MDRNRLRPHCLSVLKWDRRDATVLATSLLGESFLRISLDLLRGTAAAAWTDADVADMADWWAKTPPSVPDVVVADSSCVEAPPTANSSSS